MMDPREVRKDKWRKRRRELLFGSLAGIPVGILLATLLIGLPAIRMRWALASQHLEIPTLEHHGFDPNALITLITAMAYPGSASFQTSGSGFVVGNGRYVLTAAHCVDLENRKSKALSHRLYVASAYYGDVFPCDIVAVDPGADLALLRPQWNGHPALSLGTERELIAADQLWIASRSSNDNTALTSPSEKRDTQDRLSLQARLECLPVISLDPNTPKSHITLDHARYIMPGWSGSPIISPTSGHVVGVTLSRYERRPLGLLESRKALGCGIQSISDFIQQQQLPTQASTSLPTPPAHPDSPQAYEAFRLSLLNFKQDLNTAYQHSQHLIRLRPSSPFAHLLSALLAVSLHKQDSSETSFQTLSKQGFKNYVTLDPHDPHGLAIAGDFMRLDKQDEEAWTFSQKALALDPNNELALYNGYLYQRQHDPNQAVQLALELVTRHPQVGDLWRHYSDILYRQKQYEQAVEAARHAIKTEPNGLYGRFLARSLEKVGRLDEARTTYAAMTQDCACQSCWLAYANFLLEHYAEDPNDLLLAKQAVASIDTSSKKRDLGHGHQKIKQKLLQIQCAQQPEQATYWYHYAQHLLKYDPNNTPQIQKALSKASDPNRLYPVNPTDLDVLKKQFQQRLKPLPCNCDHSLSLDGSSIEP